MDELRLIRDLMGNVTLEELECLDYCVLEDFAIITPSVGYSEYDSKLSYTHPANSLVVLFDEDTAHALDIHVDLKSNPSCYVAAFLPPHTSHSEEKSTRLSHYMAVMVSDPLFQEILDSYRLRPDSTSWKPFLISKDIMTLLNRFKSEYEEKKPGYRIILQNLRVIIVHEFVRALLGDLDATNTPSHGIQTALDYIQLNYMEHITIENLAQLSTMSTASFKRHFKNETKCAPMQYIIRFRLEKSKKLLRTHGISISEIALSCGFSSASHFTSYFKKHYNMNPSQYKILHDGFS